MKEKKNKKINQLKKETLRFSTAWGYRNGSISASLFAYQIAL
jgi:hypothetical protein